MFCTMKRGAAFLILFQMVVILLFFSINQISKEPNYRYDIAEISQSLVKKEFLIPSLQNKTVVHLVKNNICLDSEGVYRSCGDEAYEGMIASDRKEKVAEYEEEDVVKQDVDKQDLLKDHKESKHKGDDDDDDDDDNLDQDVNGSKESKRERAVKQFSGMGTLQKITSKKVQNADKRFVSDKRILYSEVYEQVDSLKDVKLLVIVSSAAKKRARRDSIRDTWWTQCSQDSHVRCIFFTDNVNAPSLETARKELLLEKEKYDDMVFQPIDTGLNFGYRILYQMQWAVAHYKFQFLLRVDDDTLVCLDHLLFDLPNFRTTNLQWGFLHCDVDDIFYLDEGLTMFSRDLVLNFLSQNPFRMRCHVFGDQQVANWINDLNLDPTALYVHDSRIHHSPPASDMKQYFFELDDICRKHIIIHGVYPGDMESFWELNRKRDYAKYKPEALDSFCDRAPVFHWYAFHPPFLHKPKYCIKWPTWDTSYLQFIDGTFAGREVKPE